MKSTALLTTSIQNYPKRSGKVRDLYELPEQILLVATDRISAYDVVMSNGIPDKGRVLTQISAFWFRQLAEITPTHMISTAMKDLPDDCAGEELDGRFMLCRRTNVIPVECIVRGYLAGSGWRSYRETGNICGLELPPKLKQASELPDPVFTPTTKAEEGHDQDITFEQACDLVGAELMAEIRDRSLALYNAGRAYAAEKGILLADTKFEWGQTPEGELLLIDECLTPDSSRFWPADSYKPGRSQPSFDKQFVRDYLDEIHFDRTPPGPALPVEVVQKTRAKYIEAYTRLTGEKFPWE
jgi:phosphoribosylaminoimidazole-succinocarboxamide synthase